MVFPADLAIDGVVRINQLGARSNFRRTVEASHTCV